LAFFVFGGDLNLLGVAWGRYYPQPKPFTIKACSDLGAIGKNDTPCQSYPHKTIK